MKYIPYLILFLALVSAGCNEQAAESSELQKPNILFLLADDLGYGELGSYGQRVIKTPVLDDLASKGMRFTDFYAGNAACSPSRAVLMTGKRSAINTIRGNSGHFSDDRWMRVALKKDELTIAEMLKQAGYQTGFIGKWHLDDPNDFSTWACNRGFDYAVQEQWESRFGGIEFRDYEWVNAKEDSVRYDRTKWVCKDEFRTDLAFEYLDDIDRDKPFFLFMSYRAPHAHEGPIQNKTLYADKAWPEIERTHAAKVTLLDRQIGRMLNKLEEMGELENTLVLFTSDNGPHNEWGHDHDFFNSNGSLIGYKRDMYEGGIRVPLIVYWNGRIVPGTVTGHIGGFQDLMPTFADAAGLNSPEQSDGISILPVLKGEPAEEHEFLNWEFQRDLWGRISTEEGDGGFYQSARMGQWKAVRYGLNSSTRLFNLDKDISESNNLAAEYPEIVQQMERIFKEERTETEGFPYGGVFHDIIPKEKHDLSQQ